MGFAEEVAQMRSGEKTTSIAAAGPAVISAAATAQAEPPTAAAAAAQHELDMLPTGTQPLDGSVVVLEPTKKVEATPAEEAPLPKVKIAGKEFNSLDEAMAYAEQLEIANREDKAFKEGFQKAKGADAAPAEPVKTLDDEVEEILFESPKEAIKKLREGIQKEMWEAYTKMTTAEHAQVQQKATYDATWNDFYQSNSDLSESREYVEFVTQKNLARLKDTPTAKALEEIAEIARKGLRLTKEAALPKQELQSKPAIMGAGGGSATTSQTQVTSAEPIDFIAQLAKLRKRK